MNFFTNNKLSARQAGFEQTWRVILVSGLTAIGGIASAQEPISLVPSIGVASTPSVASREQAPEPARRNATTVPVNTARITGYTKWNDVPVSKRVPLTRASFDKTGYRLYNTTGATINVPFANRDLHVMKFAISPDDTTFFVNDGVAPVLYLPQNGCLLNSNVSGLRWYPFSAQFHPVQPVFLAVAPSYSEFIGISWYPNTITYGGYYGVTSFIDGGVFQPTAGLTFYIGTQSYGGWSPYRDYVIANPRRYSRPRVPVTRPQQYADDPTYNEARNGNSGYGPNAYPQQYGGYYGPDNGYPFPGGGFGFPGGGFGYPGGGASSGSPVPPQSPTPNSNRVGPSFNRVGPSFNRVGPRLDNGFGYGFGPGYPQRY
ncbi:MAG: hypothetical protein H7145_05415 [Akkermansiaceae bacterium]|nr:hypothetical protein [Armatimonadota bacterium]